MPKPEDDLIRHFAARDGAAQAKQRAAKSEAEQRAEQQAGVVEAMKSQMLPTMETLRDFLLERNFPAKVRFVPSADPGSHDAALSFHCSTDIKDYNKPGHAYPFFAAYVLEKGRLLYKTNKPDGKPPRAGQQSVDHEIDANNLTADDVSQRITAFIKLVFPI